MSQRKFKTVQLIAEPSADYALLDFGNGRSLEKMGAYTVDRPNPSAQGPVRETHWQADWVHVINGATGMWRPNKQGMAQSWRLSYPDKLCQVDLDSKGGTGFQAEQSLCAQWVEQRLSGCYHIENLRVLILFGNSDSVTASACAAGATVVHVNSSADQLDRSRALIDDNTVEWVCEDPLAHVEQLVRENQKFHLILIRPPQIQRGPHHRSWDIKVDMASLVGYLPRLLAQQHRGVWLSPQVAGWQPESLAALLYTAMPGRDIEMLQLAIRCVDGRILQTGVAARLIEDEMLTTDGERPPLDAAGMEERLDVPLEAVLSSRRTASKPAHELAGCSREQQEFVLHWVDVLSRTNAEMAFQFAVYAHQAISDMDLQGVKEWLLQAVDEYDVRGLHAAIVLLKDVHEYANKRASGHSKVDFEQYAAVLELFVRGLSGRKLRLEAADKTYTDTETLFVPGSISLLHTGEQNFGLYKLIVVFQWAQVWYGSFRLDLGKRLSVYDDTDKAAQLFQRLEFIRLQAVIARDLPGLHRTMTQILEQTGEAIIPESWRDHTNSLLDLSANVETSLAILATLYPAELPAPLCFQGVLNIEQVDKTRNARLLREKNQFRTMLAQMENETGQQPEQEQLPSLDEGSVFELVTKDHEADGQSFELLLDGQPVAPPEEARGLMASIMQDLGEIPPEYLVAAGPGAYHVDQSNETENTQDVWMGTYHEEGAFLYNEWDYKRQQFRKNWCVLRELDGKTRSADFIDQTLLKYKGLTHSIRRTFEILRGEPCVLKRQPYGDDIDLDALVEAHADMSVGMEMTNRLFMHKQKLERNIAVMFMVDMSGSTKGWINEAERESLILLCEALEILGDRYAIYGFSGMTRKRCELFRIKRFDEDYSEQVQMRISGIAPKDYTRMGVTIRHLSKMLNEVDARTKLLVTLSDGKPDDFDGYRGEYGIEDTRKALIEARQMGIHPFCITIDSEGADYLPHMYGAVNYTVVDEVRKLPLKVSDIYRQLTS